MPAILCDRGRLVCWDAWSKEGICVRTMWWLRYHFLDLPLRMLVTIRIIIIQFIFFVGNPNLNLVFGDFPRGDFGNRLGHFFVASGLLGRDGNFSLLQGGPLPVIRRGTKGPL